MNPRIYVATHKPFYCPNDEMYVPVIAGKSFRTEICNEYIGDNSGDNISYLNKTLCELTVLYWVWKNTDDKIVGINHYRRYFAPKEEKVTTYNYTNINGYILSKEMLGIAGQGDFQEFDENGVDMITVSHTNLGAATVESNYAEHHNIEDWAILRDLLKERHPDYVDFFDFFSRQHRMSTLNIFVAKRSVLNDYCSWLFPVMLDMAKMPFYRNYDSYQGRVLGFLAERLFNVWMLRNRKKYNFVLRDVYSVETSV